jgi:hypothetical protein
MWCGTGTHIRAFGPRNCTAARARTTVKPRQFLGTGSPSSTIRSRCVTLVNYPDLPHSGLPGPRLLRSGLPVSMSELASSVDTAVPDSAGDFPLWAVRSVPLLPIRHSATTAVARFLSRLNNVESVASIFLPYSTAAVLNLAKPTGRTDDGAVSPPYSAPCGRSVEGGGLAPAFQLTPNSCDPWDSALPPGWVVRLAGTSDLA